MLSKKILNNEISKTWSGMKAGEYKEFKDIRKESLRYNITDIEIALTDREFVKEYKPLGLEENKKIAHDGGEVAKVTRDNFENKLGKSVISKSNSLNYQYINDEKLVLSKKMKKMSKSS